MAQGQLILDGTGEPFSLRVIVPGPKGLGYMNPRPYQDTCVDRYFDSVNQYISDLIVMATGTGKTVVFSEICIRWPEDAGRILVIAHREELIFQAAEKIEVHTGERPAIEMGRYRESTEGHGLLDKSKVLIASVQTLSRQKRRAKFNPEDFGLIIIDEAHHSMADTYIDLVKYFRSNPHLRILGVTATPKRHDKKGMASVFQTCSFQMGILESVQDGWLVGVRQKLVVVEGLDFSKCRPVGGDLNTKDIEGQMLPGGLIEGAELTPLEMEQLEQQEKMLHAVAVPTIKESNGRPTLIFCVTKAHSNRMAEICRRYPGVTAESVTDETPAIDRVRIIGEFKAGKIQILCGCGIFTEGFDCRVDVIGMARPTKSESLYIQMLGRGTRPLPNTVDRHDTVEGRLAAIAESDKPFMTVLDFVGVSGKHKLITSTDVLAGTYTPGVLDAVVERMRETGEAVDVLDALSEEAAKQAREEAERKAKFIAEERERKRLEAERAEQRRKQQEEEDAKRRRVRAEAQYRTRDVDPFGRQPVPEQKGVGVFRGGATDAMIYTLVKHGWDRAAAMRLSKSAAGAIIGKIKSGEAANKQAPVKATDKQREALEKLGATFLAADMTYQQAADRIIEIQRNKRQIQGAKQ